MNSLLLFIAFDSTNPTFEAKNQGLSVYLIHVYKSPHKLDPLHFHPIAIKRIDPGKFNVYTKSTLNKIEIIKWWHDIRHRFDLKDGLKPPKKSAQSFIILLRIK